MLDAADLKGQSISFASARAAPAAALRTAMDTYLPFGRLVGVELPVKITEEAMRVASAELMPEEVSYCLGLHPAMQARGGVMVTGSFTDFGIVLLRFLSLLDAECAPLFFNICVHISCTDRTVEHGV